LAKIIQSKEQEEEGKRCWSEKTKQESGTHLQRSMWSHKAWPL